MAAPRTLQKPPGGDRLKLQDPNLLQPLELLLLWSNDFTTYNTERRLEFVKTALPYCHVPKAAEPPPSFDFSNLRTAEQMMAAQRTVMKSVGEGRTTPQTGKTMVEALAVMIKCLDVTTLEDRLEQVEAQASAAATGRPTLAYPAPDTDPWIVPLSVV
jgi:hypothetical protein